MKLKPLGDNLIVKGISEQKTTASGIVLPDTLDKEKPEQGEVIAIGPGRMLDSGSRAAMNVQVGDRILFKKYSPDEVKVGEEEYLVISEKDVIAIIDQ